MHLHWLIINGFVRKCNTLVGSIRANLQTFTCVSNHVHILSSSGGFITGLSNWGPSFQFRIPSLPKNTLKKKRTEIAILCSLDF